MGVLLALKTEDEVKQVPEASKALHDRLTRRSVIQSQLDALRAKRDPLTGWFEREIEAMTILDEQLAAIDAEPPIPGLPCTYEIGSDRYGCTIVSVSPSAHQIWYQMDNSKGPSLFLPNAGAKVECATRRKGGVYRPAGSKCGRILIGFREQYIDPCF